MTKYIRPMHASDYMVNKAYEGLWKCPVCGAECDWGMDKPLPEDMGAWRQVDGHLEHQCPDAHPQCGHFRCERIS
jgi:hypothetical protein